MFDPETAPSQCAPAGVWRAASRVPASVGRLMRGVAHIVERPSIRAEFASASPETVDEMDVEPRPRRSARFDQQPELVAAP